ncbi:MAG: hypothetical protein RIT04_596 [Candidatus Parcubacteria bacterium]|jgi:glycosyltransferase involved in cell wall biosynthesis
MKTKILYIITKSNWGGAQRYVYDLATSLSKDLYDVEVVVGGNGPLADKLTAAGITVTSLPTLGRDLKVKDDWKAFCDLIRIFRQKRPTIIHLNSSKIGIIGSIAGRITRVPQIVFTAHGWAFNENRSFASKLVLKVLYWQTMMFSHVTIAVSEYMKKSVMNWPFMNSRITVIYNGIRVAPLISKANARHELTRTNAALATTIANIPANKIFWIGTVAELHPIKGHDVALRAIKQLVANDSKISKSGKHIIYTILGDGEERERLASLVNDLGLSQHVFFLGRTENAWQYMKAFDLFLLASRSEALAYVLLEAGLATIPCVATAVGGIPEIIDDMKSGVLIQPEKPSEIAYAIDFLATHEHVRREYATALHKKALEQFNFEISTQKTFELYNRFK